MPRFYVVGECRACGNPADGRYCPPCRDNVREMVDEYNSVSARELYEADGGEIHGA